MSLGGALQIGRSALEASQRAIEVTGNNLANLSTEGYHRQSVALTSARSQELRNGVFVGRGVQLEQIIRHVDEALQTRIRSAVSDQSASQATRDILTQIESIQNELSDIDLSSRLGAFFNAWSELANSPNEESLRSLVVESGKTLADYMVNYRADLTALRSQVDRSIAQGAEAADEMLSEIARLNREIVAASPGNSNGAHALRDQRDLLLGQLSEFFDISTVEQPSGTVDVFIGSMPVVLNGKSRGVEMRSQTDAEGQLEISLHLKADGSRLDAQSGSLGALVASREADVQAAVEFIDSFAGELIWQVNRIHSQGQAKAAYTDLIGTNRVADTTVALNDALTELGFSPSNGSFQLHVTDRASGSRTSSQIDIDLDGIGTDTSLDDLAAAINGVANVSASITSDGRLQISGLSSNFEVSFSDDSSGALAALGLNTFFRGENAEDIGVNAEIVASPARIAAARGHVEGDNRNALALAGLRDMNLNNLGGQSLTTFWNRHVEDYGVRLGEAVSGLESDTIVVESLQAQNQTISGVNADEEAINLLQFQRSYQGAARFITVVDEMMQTLISLV